MKKNDHSTESWAQDSYETGSTKPAKSHGGLVAVLLVLVIMLCGVSSYLGVLNIRLGLQLQQTGGEDTPIQFLPQSTDASNPSETTLITDGVLPGVEGRTVSSPEQAFYHWPAGVVVTKVMPGSAAAEAGLMIGDILTGVNGRTVSDTEALQEMLSNLQPGTTITVTFFRDDSYHSFQCDLE